MGHGHETGNKFGIETKSESVRIFDEDGCSEQHIFATSGRSFKSGYVGGLKSAASLILRLATKCFGEKNDSKAKLFRELSETVDAHAEEYEGLESSDDVSLEISKKQLARVVDWLNEYPEAWREEAYRAPVIRGKKVTVRAGRKSCAGMTLCEAMEELGKIGVKSNVVTESEDELVVDFFVEEKK